MHVDWSKNKSTTKLEEEDVLELPTGNESNKVKEEATNVDVDMKKKTNEKIVREMRKLESLFNPQETKIVDEFERGREVVREMRKLENWFNPQETKIVDEFERGREIVLEQVNLALLTTSFTKEPSSFEKAINRENKDDQEA
jgi:hypothetical protein